MSRRFGDINALDRSGTEDLSPTREGEAYDEAHPRRSYLRELRREHGRDAPEPGLRDEATDPNINLQAYAELVEGEAFHPEDWKCDAETVVVARPAQPLAHLEIPDIHEKSADIEQIEIPV